MFTAKLITALAGKRNFDLGLQLLESGSVLGLQVSGNETSAVVRGSERYRVTLHVHQDHVSNSCECPAAEYQDFCKHCVAVALASMNPDALAVKNDPLRQKLEALDKAELVAIALRLIEQDEHEFKQWQLKIELANKGSSVADLKKLITKALPLVEIWNWREVADYFELANQQFDMILEQVSQLSVNERWQVMQHALTRLSKVLHKLDDSQGARFHLEMSIKQQIQQLFAQLDWREEEQAAWLFSLIANESDIAPSIDEFAFSANVKALLLERCQEKVEQLSGRIDKKDFDQNWQLSSYTDLLIKEAQDSGDWQQQVALKNLTAVHLSDYEEIIDICITNQQPQEAQSWLLAAKENVEQEYIHPSTLRELEIKVLMANGERQAAWQICWQSFKTEPSYRSLTRLKEQSVASKISGEQWLADAEEILIAKAKKATRFESYFQDDVMRLFLEQNRLQDAKTWQKGRKIAEHLLLNLADCFIEQASSNEYELIIACYKKAAESAILLGNNTAYQEALDTLKRLESKLANQSFDRVPFEQLIRHLASEYKRKRNMLKLLTENYGELLD